MCQALGYVPGCVALSLPCLWDPSLDNETGCGLSLLISQSSLKKKLAQLDVEPKLDLSRSTLRFFSGLLPKSSTCGCDCVVMLSLSACKPKSVFPTVASLPVESSRFAASLSPFAAHAELHAGPDAHSAADAALLECTCNRTGTSWSCK